PAVSSVIVGIRDVNQATCNMAVLTQEHLSHDQLAQIAQLWDESLRFHVRTSIGELGEGERRAQSACNSSRQSERGEVS
ncbi:MAG TPA: hypothetical protein VFV38_20520, partial [Ktedonobacteraceae bacterium]|nr:hypothetical protein [Ktedonobacteraceae bacterium]